MSLKITMNGREIRPDQFAAEMQKTMVLKIQTSIEEKVMRLRCPVHGKAPEMVGAGNGLSSMQIKGCCENFIQRVKRELGGK